MFLFLLRGKDTQVAGTNYGLNSKALCNSQRNLAQDYFLSKISFIFINTYNEALLK